MSHLQQGFWEGPAPQAESPGHRGPGRTPLAPTPLGLLEAASPSLCFCTHLVSLFPFSRHSFSPL